MSGRISARRFAIEQRIDDDQAFELVGGYSRSVLDFYGIGPFNDYLVDMDHAFGDARYSLGPWAFRLNYAHMRCSVEHVPSAECAWLRPISGRHSRIGLHLHDHRGHCVRHDGGPDHVARDCGRRGTFERHARHHCTAPLLRCLMSFLLQTLTSR